MERSKSSHETVRREGKTFEEITGLPDIDIVVIDDALDRHAGKSEIEPVIPDVNVDLEDISDFAEAKTVPQVIVDETVILHGPDVLKSPQTDLDIELMSLEVDGKKAEDISKPITSADHGTVSGAPVAAQIFPDDRADELSHEELEKTVSIETGAAAVVEKPGDARSEAELLDEIITIVDDESLSNMRSDHASPPDNLVSNELFPEQDALSLDVDIKTNRINGISEIEAKNGSVPGYGDELPDLDSLDDEFIILQSDLEGDALREPTPVADETEGMIAVEEEAGKSDADHEERAKREKRISEIIIDISGEEKKSFTVKDFKAIDLREAEKVATEEILLLSEEDLIEELEEIDLMPVEDEHGEKVDIKIISDDESFQKDIDAILKEMEEDISFQSELAKKDKGGEEEVRETGMSAEETAVEEDILTGVEEAPVSVMEQQLETSTPAVIEHDEVQSEESQSLQELQGVSSEERAPEAKEENVEFAVSDIPPEEVRIELESDKIPPEVEAVHEIELAGDMPREIEIEVLPEEITGIPTGENVFIIDDQSIDKGGSRIDEKIFEENELERITAGMVEVVEGNSVLLREANIEEDKEKIASIMSGTAPAFEDLLIESEEKYIFREEDITFVDRIFISPEYYEYHEKLEKSAGIRDRGEITNAVELFGLTDKEFDTIEKSVFKREYEGIDLKEIAKNIRVGYNEPEEDRELLKKYDYIVASPASLGEEEKRSIEEDIESASAIIFEEDVEEIKARLSVIRTERQKDAVSEVTDISDSVFILDDEMDVERFTATMPVEKQDKIKRLLKYLDGLFEKLPEEVIRKFAESEYFNLYTQVLHDLER